VKFLLFAIKLAITGALAWVLFTRIDFAPIGHFLKSGHAAGPLTLGVGVFLVQAVLAALRFRLIMRLMGTPFPLYLGFSTWMIGLIVSQTMVTFIAGDAARIWQLARRGYGRRLSGSAVFLERALGFAVLMAMVLICIPFLLSQGATGAVRTGLLMVAGLCAAGIGGFVLSGFFSRVAARLAPRLHAQRIAAAVVDVTSAARHLTTSWPVTAGVVMLSAVMHLLNASVFYILADAVGMNLDIVTIAAVALPVMLIALMPVALAGWGVREGAAVVGYGLFGVAPETAVTISVGFGLALLVASLPGAIYLWRGKPAPATVPAQTENESLPV
jgi:uncharacterized protein (TIRG00374 family)